MTSAFAKEDFLACKLNEDCTFAIGNCGEIVSINLSSLERNLQIRKKSEELISCSKLAAPRDYDFLKSECIQSECKLRTVRNINEKIKKISIIKLEEKLKKVRDYKTNEKYYDCFREIVLIRNEYGNSEDILKEYEFCKAKL